MNVQEYRPSGFNYLPPVVKNLLILNGLAFLAMLVLDNRLGIDLTRYFALYHFSSEYFKPFQYVTYMFLHGGVTHIFFNMFALWMFGNVLENVWGPKRFLIYYFITGMGAALVHTLYTTYQLTSIEHAAAAFFASPGVDQFEIFINRHVPEIWQAAFRTLLDAWSNNPGDASYVEHATRYINQIIESERNIPTVGASGAVYGLLLAFGILFPNTMIYLYMAIPIKAKYFVILYGAIELYMGFSSGDSIAHFAHLGGMVFGFLFIRYWGKY